MAVQGATKTTAASVGSSSQRGWLTVAVIAVLALAIVPLLTERHDILNLLFLVFLSVCLGQSWNMLGGFAGQVNLGHAAFFGIGAQVTRTLWIGGTAYPLALATGAVSALLFAMVIGIPTFRLRGVYFAIG